MNQKYRDNRTRQAYQNISKISEGLWKQNRFLAEEDGTLIKSLQDIEKKLMECFENLFNSEKPADTFLYLQMKYSEEIFPLPTLV